MQNFVLFDHVCKTYRMGDVCIDALKDASFTIAEGEICVIVGQSGAGKTTLLNILGGMDRLTSGHVLLAGEDVSGFDRKRLTTYRRHEVGFVFQFYNLLPNMTALENVQIAGQLCKDPIPADEVQQRVAIARALAKRPQLLLCDEPTGALDYQTGKQILALLQKQSRENGMTVVIITHNSALTAMADRVIRVRSGQITDVRQNAAPVPVESIEW